MARILGGIASSRSPTIGFALDAGTQFDPAWAPLFRAYEPVRQKGSQQLYGTASIIGASVKMRVVIEGEGSWEIGPRLPLRVRNPWLP